MDGFYLFMVILFIILLVMFVVGALALVIYILIFLLNYKRKINFINKFGIDNLPKSIRVKKNKFQKRNYYELKYPYWQVSKKDGTADLRVKFNSIIWQESALYFDSFKVVSKMPYDLIDVVKKLRLLGNQIDMCEEEKKKCLNLKKKKEVFSCNLNIQKLIDYYSKRPSEFEKLCSKLFDSLGYISELTPPTNDGGYDILLKKNGEQTIVECKCYSIEHKIGRPAIQKLVGANKIVLADKLIFITTSNFSSSAIQYAEEVCVELINGYNLMELFNKQGFIKKQQHDVNVSEWQLQTCDLCSYVPNDIYKRYFI